MPGRPLGLPDSCELRESDVAGRFLVAGSRGFQRGEVVLARQRPLVSALMASAQDERCHGCWAPAAQKMQRCSGCRKARYCSRSCQRRAWAGHKKECECLREYYQGAAGAGGARLGRGGGGEGGMAEKRDPYGLPTVMLVARLLLMSKASSQPPELSELEGLVSNLVPATPPIRALNPLTPAPPLHPTPSPTR